jgi:hypothetical protein
MDTLTGLQLKSLAFASGILLCGVGSNLAAVARPPATPVGGPATSRGGGVASARDPGTVVNDPGTGQGAGPHKGSAACPVVTPVLTALVPTYKTSTGKLAKEAKTLEERPTVWIYVPYALDKVVGELQVQKPDEGGIMSYQTVATVTGTQPGIVGVRLPATDALKESQRLKWRFVVICDRNDPTANPSTYAVIERRAKNPVLAKQIQSATPAQLGALYGKEGLWYDVLMRLATLRQQKPTDASLVKDWQALLRQGGLSVFDSKDLSRKAP